MENSIAAKRPELVPEWSVKNLPITPDKVPYGSNKLYWWIGSCGHEWQASAKARSCGEKCPICSNARIIPGVNDLATLVPELAKEWSEKNKPLEPTMVTPGTHKKVIWHGKCGHEWAAPVRNRVKGARCPYCSHNILLPGFNDLETLFPKLAQEWSERNFPLLPSQVMAYSNQKVWWRCSKGHEWNTLISTRSYGSKCPYCSGIRTLKGYNDFATLYPDIAKEWSDRNGALKPDMVNDKSTKNVWWKCDICGYEYKAVIKARVHGRDCPVCAARKVLSGYNDLATTDSELLEEWDYEKNISIVPTRISRNSMKSVWWKCKYGHSWKEKIVNRTISHNSCKTCELEFLRVLPQLLIMLYCGQRYLKVNVNDIDLLGISLDAYIPDANLVIVTSMKNTKSKNDALTVIQHQCRQRGLLCEIIPITTPQETCLAIKHALAKAHIYIVSDMDQDIDIARKSFFSLKTDKSQALKY